MQSYNHPAWQCPRPPHHSTSLDVPHPQFAPVPPRSRHTSITGPSPYVPQTALNSPQSIVPPSLTPGRHRAKIWDKSATQGAGTIAMPTPSPYYSPQRSSLYGDYFFSQPPAPLPRPPLPQKPQALLKPLTNPLPPIPPKPPALAVAPRIPLYPTSIPLPVLSPSSQTSDPLPPDPLPSPDAKEVELALTLSETEARRREQELIAQEEEELARALEESRLMSNTIYTLDEESSSTSSSPTPPSVDRASISAIRASARPPEGESWLHMITPTASTSSTYSINDDFSSSHPSLDRNEFNDDPDDIPPESPNTVETSQAPPRDPSSPTPPLYANVVSNLVRSPLPTPPTSHSTVSPSLSSTSPSAYLQGDAAPPLDRLPSSPSLSVAHSSNESSPMPPFVSRTSWSSASSENSTPTGRSLGSELLSASGLKSPTHSSGSPDLSLGSSGNLDPLEEEVEETDTEAGPSARPTVPLTANHYVEREMLIGVSLGFSIPVISTELVPMATPMPNVITLPYGKAPVFHFQAPSWRKLLKLMARLSGTRVEPTPDSFSIAKHELRLRTVIQFVKIHHSASEWRTVLYLTTDYPVPCSLLNAHKYTNGDVTVLPYSYSLSPLPALLRDGSESQMAKYYVVPSTPTTPYPNLPINFPNLAMYLQSAVQDSRRAVNDSSSGLRKLAQYIDGCYQMEAERVDQEVAGRRGVGGMIKRVMGRNRANKNSRGNEEIYDLVTPFVSDEWG